MVVHRKTVVRTTSSEMGQLKKILRFHTGCA